MKRKTAQESRRSVKKVPFPYHRFHKTTNITVHPPRPVRIPQTALKELNAISYKKYPQSRPFQLSSGSLPRTTLQSSLLSRSSAHNFSKKPLSKKTLGLLLQYSAGIKNNSDRRPYPSAGARYPLETYLYILNSDLPSGLYHYNIRSNVLEQLGTDKSLSQSSLLHQEWIFQAGCILFITAVFKRTTVKYGNRGYRYVLMEVGHLMQNLSLVSASLHLNGCIVGGFADDKINSLLDINDKEEAVMGIFVSGHK